MNTLPDHLEAHLGGIVCGWSVDADGQKLPFQVVQFADSPIAGARVVTTLGLSNAPLRVGNTSRRLRQELLMMFREVDGPQNLPGVLQQVGLEALSNDRAFSVGDVLGPRAELRVGSTLEALYVALPVYLPDSFHVFKTGASEAIVFGWLVPIAATEASFIRAKGREAFEMELEKHDPDLLDFQRPPIV